MRRPRVVFSKEALLGIVYSAGEQFREECYGFVFGDEPRGNRGPFSVTWVHQMGRVKRESSGDNSFVIPDARAQNRLKALFEATHAHVLGHIHSHPQKGSSTGDTRISNSDFERMENWDNSLEVIVSIFSYRGRKGIPWYVLGRDRSLRGSLGRFRFCIRVYARLGGEGKKKELYMLPIASSAAKILNSIQTGP